MLRLLMPDVRLGLEEDERAVLAAVPLLSLVVQLDVRQQVPRPLELPAALLARGTALALAVRHGQVLVKQPTLGEQALADVARAVQLQVKGQMPVQLALRRERLAAVRALQAGRVSG